MPCPKPHDLSGPTSPSGVKSGPSIGTVVTWGHGASTTALSQQQHMCNIYILVFICLAAAERKKLDGDKEPQRSAPKFGVRRKETWFEPRIESFPSCLPTASSHRVSRQALLSRLLRANGGCRAGLGVVLAALWLGRSFYTTPNEQNRLSTELRFVAVI